MTQLEDAIKIVHQRREFCNSQKVLLKKEIDKLPKGTIQEKTIKNNIYYYLQYRKRGKITHDYLGKEFPTDLDKQIKKRKRLEAKLRPINEELKILRKMKV